MTSLFRSTFLLTLFCIFGNKLVAQVQTYTIKSPNQNVTATFFLDDSLLKYNVAYKGKTVIEQSALGLEIDGSSYNSGRSIIPSKTVVIHNTFPWRGVHQTAYHYARSANIKVKSAKTGFDWAINVQVFNGGVAFRYVIPHNGASKITRELTTFTIPEKSDVWWQGDIQNYEGSYSKNKPAAIKENQTIGLPITVVLPQQLGFASIAEADVNQFAGMHLIATGSNTFNTALEGDVNLNGNIRSPWRVITIGKDLNAIVNNDMIASLSPKADPLLFPKGFNTRWIKPGKSVWSWMTDNRAVTPENMRKFTDLAAQCGIPYNLVDDGWAKWQATGKDKWQMMKEVVDYSTSKNVKIWVWAAYPDNNGVPGLKDSANMVNFLQKCREAGVVGVKIDFMSSDSQNMMEFYNRASREAAKLHLMIDFHGASKPSGQSRTWPNELTREAVRGLEYNEDTDWPTHNTIVPFTRYLAGPGDYTPLSMSKFVSNTSLAHQVATMAVFTSPFLCLGVDPQDLLKSETLPFVKEIPSVWDETIVLAPSAIGEVCVMARRSGKNWFLAVLNNKEPKTVTISLSFLAGKDYTYRMLSNEKLKNDNAGKTKSGKDKIIVNLKSGDGLVAIFKPLK